MWSNIWHKEADNSNNSKKQRDDEMKKFGDDANIQTAHQAKLKDYPAPMDKNISSAPKSIVKDAKNNQERGKVANDELALGQELVRRQRHFFVALLKKEQAPVENTIQDFMMDYY